MNDNYMKTILSGVKEWTENLTDDAADKANNALDKANKSIDKALFVVNITSSDGITFSADKTFEEIKQVYDEGKYHIVLKFFDNADVIFPLTSINESVISFDAALGQMYFSFNIRSDNKILFSPNALAFKSTKLPNPYPLTFTGAVNATYDGSSAKTIKIPSGGGSAHEVIIASSTAGSTKKFKITVDDSGTISATEVV